MTEGNPDKFFKTVVGGAIATGAAIGAATGPVGEVVAKEVTEIFTGKELLADVPSPEAGRGERVTVVTPEGEERIFTKPREGTDTGE
jgi:hypothetical protein